MYIEAMTTGVAILLFWLATALGSPADPLLEGVLRHKRLLQLRQITSQVDGDEVATLPRFSRQLEDIIAPPADASESGRQVRLVGGPGPWQGAVEVHTASGWHQVVANRWSEAEASVVCRQLGHTSYFLAAPLPNADMLSLHVTDAAPFGIHKCSGQESSLLDCSRANVESAARPVSVTCLGAKDLNERCAEGELPFNDGCYYIGHERQTRLKAYLSCGQRGASLVVVNSQRKNDFLSGVISSMGLDGIHTAGRSYRIGKDRTIWNWEGSNAPFFFRKWNPAEPPQEPLGVEQRCLTLQPTSAAETDYAFGSSSDCSYRLQYVCERPRNWTDCARDLAGSYAGTVTTAESGRQCLSWETTTDVPGLSSATLVDNHCRNPDGDLRPWCFTAPDRFEYCDIVACPPYLPPLAPKDFNYTCRSNQFACGDGRCITITNVCDGAPDCPNGRDETICSKLSTSFQTFAEKDVTPLSSTKLVGTITANKNIGERTCQFICLADVSCYAASYGRKICVRVLRPLGEYSLISGSGSNVHVVLDRYIPCGGYRCDDFQCLNRTVARCDGTNDCNDASDELNCAAVSPVPLRLVDSAAAAGSGRLEARFQGRWGAVCDDNFGSRAADVACRQLGFHRHRRLFVNGRGYPANGNGDNFAISFVGCTGEEKQFADCILLYQKDRCTAGEHVSLECTSEPGKCTLLTNFFECLDGSGCVAPSELCDGRRKCGDGSDESEDVCSTLKVRLTQTDSEELAMVEVKPPSSQRPFLAVISRSFTSDAANFLCRSLGGGPYGLYLEDADPLPEAFLVAGVQCSSADSCTVQQMAPGPGAHAIRLGCLMEKPPSLMLRLVGGNERSGLLELQPPFQDWGRVCATTFNAAQAKVTCRQLGFGGRAEFLEVSRNPNVTVSLKAMDCLGEEDSIMKCLRLPWNDASGPEACGDSGEVYLSCDAAAAPPTRVTPLTSQCAAIAADNQRVLNGRRAKQPAFARLQLRVGDAWKLRCGSTVISERFLLTAAHCVKPSASDRLLGMFDLPTTMLSVVTGDGVRRAMRRVLTHPGHSLLAAYSDDLALVELERDIEFSAAVQPACLPPEDAGYPAGLACSVAGYGSTRPQPIGTANQSAVVSDTLQVADVTFFTRDRCQDLYGRRNITLGMVCAGDGQYQVDTCLGDSGGPLFCRLHDATTLMGITSWGIGCGQSRRPGVYVRVASYVGWIRAQMQGAPDA